MRALDYLTAAAKDALDDAIAKDIDFGDVADGIPVFCGFVPNTVHGSTVAVSGSIADRIVTKAPTNTVIPTPKAAEECIILHVEDAVSDTIDTQIEAGEVQIEIEARLRTCGHAADAIDVILRRLERDGVLMRTLTRYDEPGRSELNYGAHSATVILTGNCPDASV